MRVVEFELYQATVRRLLILQRNAIQEAGRVVHSLAHRCHASRNENVSGNASTESLVTEWQWCFMCGVLAYEVMHMRYLSDRPSLTLSYSPGCHKQCIHIPGHSRRWTIAMSRDRWLTRWCWCWCWLVTASLQNLLEPHEILSELKRPNHPLDHSLMVPLRTTGNGRTTVRLRALREAERRGPVAAEHAA
jgi:hypothetical protein